MKLSSEDAQLFYKLFFTLLDYVNEKRHVNDLEDIAHATSLNPNDVAKVAHNLWDDPRIIDDYLKDHSLDQEEAEIVESWKHCVHSKFVIERILKSGAMFIGMHDEVYKVLGTISELEDVFFYYPKPILLETCLLPFKGKIITDGLFFTFNVRVGPNARGDFKDIYMNAKRSGQIIDSL